MYWKSLYLIAAFLAGANADSSCSFDGTTMTEAASISQLGSCPTLEGTLEISGDGIGSLNLGSVQEIKGDIHIFNSSSATDINLNQLSKITGTLSVDALTQLHVIDFSKLSEINDLSLISLPSLSSLNVNTGISKLANLKVSDTALSSLQGIITQVTSVNQLDIDNNKNITQLELGNLQEVTEGLILSFNGDDCEVSLDNLQYASNLTLQDIGSISASNLTAVNGSLIIAYNKFDTFNLPLEEVGGALQIFANDDLTTFELSNLTEVGGEVNIFNNSNLEDMSETFDSLQKIKGAVNIDGSFSNLTMSDLEEVDGDFTVKSDNEDFDCKAFKQLYSNKKIEGHNFKCVAPEKNQSSGSASLATETFGASGGSDDESDSSSESSTSSESNANGLYLGGSFVAVFFTSLFSVLI